MVKSKVINLNHYRELKKKNKIDNIIGVNEIPQNHTDEEERIKTLDLFMKVITTMYKESYK